MPAPGASTARSAGQVVAIERDGAAGPAPMYDRMRRLARSVLVVLTGFLASRALGVVRNIVIAAHFGTGSDYEAYLAAIAVPDLVFQVLVGGAVGSAFIPVFKQYLAEKDEADAWRLTSSVINVGVLVAGAASVVLAVFADRVMDVMVPARDPAFRDLATGLTHILLISPAIFAASTFCASVLNSYHRFAVAALAPLMYNLAIIVGAVFLSAPLGIYGLALGAVAGATLHFFVQVPALVRLGMRWRPEIDLRLPGVREVGRLFLPRVLGLAAVQVNLVLSGVVFASFLGPGRMAYLNYAYLMIMTPLALAMAVGTAVFPTLSEESALGNRDRLQQVFVLSLRMILFLTIPASVGLMVLGEPTISLFFERGRFTEASTQGTAYALVFYALGLAGHATVEIVDRVFYALHDTRTPVLAAVGAIVLNVVLSLTLMQTPLSYGGLALASSLAALVEGSVLVRLISRRIASVDADDILRSALRTLGASLVMGIPLALVAQALEPLASSYGTPGQAVLVGGGALLGALVFGVVAYLFGSDELLILRRLVKR